MNAPFQGERLGLGLYPGVYPTKLDEPLAFEVLPGGGGGGTSTVK